MNAASKRSLLALLLPPMPAWHAVPCRLLPSAPPLASYSSCPCRSTCFKCQCIKYTKKLALQPGAPASSVQTSTCRARQASCCAACTPSPPLFAELSHSLATIPAILRNGWLSCRSHLQTAGPLRCRCKSVKVAGMPLGGALSVRRCGACPSIAPPNECKLRLLLSCVRLCAV